MDFDIPAGIAAFLEEVDQFIDIARFAEEVGFVGAIAE